MLPPTASIFLQAISSEPAPHPSASVYAATFAPSAFASILPSFLAFPPPIFQRLFLPSPRGLVATDVSAPSFSSLVFRGSPRLSPVPVLTEMP